MRRSDFQIIEGQAAQTAEAPGVPTASEEAIVAGREGGGEELLGMRRSENKEEEQWHTGLLMVGLGGYHRWSSLFHSLTSTLKPGEE